MASVAFISGRKLSQIVGLACETNDLQAWLQDGDLVLGNGPLHPMLIVDLALERVRPWSDASSPENIAAQTSPRRSRQSGQYQISIHGKIFHCRSLWDLLGCGLKEIEVIVPGTLEKLSSIKSRSKRIVARSPSHLFENPDLVENYSEPLIEGWWFGKNNSADETIKWLKKAAEIANLQWDRDIVLSI